jgi:glycosyltransferase involved in cell wall biosynthesis
MANQTRQLAKLLREEGVEVDIVQVNLPYRPTWIKRLRGFRAVFRLLPYLLRLWQSAGRADLIHVMANSGWAWHLFAAPAVWLGHWRGKPVVVNYRGGEAESFFKSQFRWVKPTLAHTSLVVVPSGFLEAVFARRAVSAFIVPNIIDLARFSPSVGRQRGCHLIVTRNLEDIYDIPTALRAFAAIRSDYPAARLTVAGSGPRRHDLEHLCEELNIDDAVHFTGRLDNEHIAELYRSADVLLNPSLADNMPISLLEAMASGVPIVSTDVGGIPYLVKHEEGALLVPPGQPAQMAAAALRVLGNSLLAEQLQAAGIESAQRYTWPKVRERLFGAYEKVLAAPLPSLKASE